MELLTKETLLIKSKEKVNLVNINRGISRLLNYKESQYFLAMTNPFFDLACKSLARKLSVPINKIKQDMVVLKKKLRDQGFIKKFIFKNSKKVYKNYKCDLPINTIKKVKSGLEKLDLYYEEHISGQIGHCYSCHLVVAEGVFIANGKGESKELARASAYAELAERISAKIYEDHRSFENISKDRYHTLVQNFLKTLKPFGVKRFADRTLKKACVGYNITSDSFEFIPIKLIHAIDGSNGISAGNTIEEATVHGICELFERHCAFSVLYERKPVPSIDSSSIKDAGIKKLIAILEKNKINVKIKDFSINNEFPVIGVLLTNKNVQKSRNCLKKQYGHRILNIASDLDMNIALKRCFTELFQGAGDIEVFKNQSYPFFAEEVSDLFGKGLLNLNSKGLLMQIGSHRMNADYLSFLEDESKIIKFSELKSKFFDDCFDELKYLKDFCKCKNLDIIILDNSNLFFQISTIRIIIPQLFHLVHLFGSKNLIRRIKEDRMGPLLNSSNFGIGESIFARKKIYESYHELKEWIADYPLIFNTPAIWVADVNIIKKGRNDSIKAKLFRDQAKNYSYGELLFWNLIVQKKYDEGEKVLVVLSRLDEKYKDLLDLLHPIFSGSSKNKLNEIKNICFDRKINAPFINIFETSLLYKLSKRKLKWLADLKNRT
jgi:YcaO-like protein with predicted kinase domain